MNWINNRLPEKYVTVLIRFPGKGPKYPNRYTVGYHDGDRWVVQHKSFREEMEVSWVPIKED